MNLKALLRNPALRLLPAVAVGLLPFKLLDHGILEYQYRLRGWREPDLRIRVMRLESGAAVPSLLSRARKVGFEKIVNFDTRLHGEPGALDLSFDNRYTQRSLEGMIEPLRAYLNPELHTQPDDATLILAHGAAFPTLPPAALYGPRVAESAREARVLVLLPNVLPSRLQVSTPAGLLGPDEIALNLVSNTLSGRFLRRVPTWISWLSSTASVAAVGWLLYTLPTSIAFSLSAVLALLHFALAMMFFDKQGLLLPVAAPWVAILTAYLLAISDKLDRRDRQHWALALRAENMGQLDEMRNNFLSLVSHDLKTPIARVQAVLQQILRGDFGGVSPKLQNGLQRISSANGHLQRTINTLLLLSRIEAHDIRLRPEPSDLTELLMKSVEAARPLARERNIEIDADLEPLFLVSLDQALIGEVVGNLIDNALKYSPPGSRLRVSCGENDNCPELFPPQPGVWFEVQDQGPGILPEDRARVLEKFVRGSQESTAADQSVKGSGLGLYLSSFFVKKHQGQLLLFSRVAGEKLAKDSPAASYFENESSGTVLRVVLPVDNSL